MARLTLVLLLTFALGGCASVMRSAQQGIAGQLEAGILNHDDPETVRSGLPAYLILLDGAIAKNPADRELLCTSAKLYGAFAGSLLAPGERAKLLAKRAWSYGARAACAGDARLCELQSRDFDQIEALLKDTESTDLPLLRCVGESWSGWIQANAEDWNAVAEIPKVKAMFERMLVLERDSGDGNVQLYLGVLNSLLPEAYGGKPKQAREYFEAALTRSKRRNLMVHVLYAERYARLVFEQELHDKLLNEVLAAASEAPGLTLINTLAKERAKVLLESGKDYF